MKGTLQFKILRTWIKVHAHSLIKTLVNNMKRESTNVPWKLSLAKKYDPPLQRKLHQNRWYFTCYYKLSFSQTNLVFTDILDSFCHSLLTFLSFNFWYSTDCWYSTKFIQCPYVLLIKTSNVFGIKMFLLCPNFHKMFLLVNGENNSWHW